MSVFNKTQLLGAAVLAAASTSAAQAITVEELAAQFEAYKKEQDAKFDQLSQENKTLKQQNQVLQSQLENTQQQVESTAAAVETVSASQQTSSGSSWFDRTSIGGYGELHYQNRSKESGDHKQEVDFHRFVLYVAHDFTEDLHFFSELELEHSISGDGKNGEIELEQAFIEYDMTDQASAKAGLFLVPVGILNETHEPDTFYGVERNEVEKYIIPTTWWEAGVGGRYRFDNGISFEAAVMSGLEVGDNFSIRSGRGKVSEQTAEDPLIVGRVKYTGIPGLELSASILHQTDLGQSDNDELGDATLYETHAIYTQPIGPGALSLRALYSHWNIDTLSGDDDIETQRGWYVEPSYRMPTLLGDVGIYGRFQQVDYYDDANKEFDIWEGGANWWLHENVVLKATYIYKKDRLKDNADERGFDLGLGYSF